MQNGKGLPPDAIKALQAQQGNSQDQGAFTPSPAQGSTPPALEQLASAQSNARQTAQNIHERKPSKGKK